MIVSNGLFRYYRVGYRIKHTLPSCAGLTRVSTPLNSATHIIAFEGDSQAVWFEGNYEDYETDRHRRLGSAADQPHRIKLKPLTR